MGRRKAEVSEAVDRIGILSEVPRPDDLEKRALSLEQEARRLRTLANCLRDLEDSAAVDPLDPNCGCDLCRVESE